MSVVGSPRSVSSRADTWSKALLFLVAVGLAGCASTRQDERQEYAFDDTHPIVPQFNSINADNGIDLREADILATIYFQKYSGMCGANFPVQKRGKKWHAAAIVGYAGSPAPDITIDIETGVIRQKGNPDSPPPWHDLRKYSLALQQVEASLEAYKTRQ